MQTFLLKVETYTVTNISTSLIVLPVITVIMYVETFITDISVVIGDYHNMCDVTLIDSFQ